MAYTYEQIKVAFETLQAQIIESDPYYATEWIDFLQMFDPGQAAIERAEIEAAKKSAPEDAIHRSTVSIKFNRMPEEFKAYKAGELVRLHGHLSDSQRTFSPVHARVIKLTDTEFEAEYFMQWGELLSPSKWPAPKIETS